jgi:hypothetical protein
MMISNISEGMVKMAPTNHKIRVRKKHPSIILKKPANEADEP